MKKKLLYISGPHSDVGSADMNGVLENILKARKAALYLMQEGAAFFCPPLNSCFMDGDGEGLGEEEFSEMDLNILDRCDGLVLLPGWSVSKGAVIEYDHWRKHSNKDHCFFLPEISGEFHMRPGLRSFIEGEKN